MPIFISRLVSFDIELFVSVDIEHFVIFWLFVKLIAHTKYTDFFSHVCRLLQFICHAENGCVTVSIV